MELHLPLLLPFPIPTSLPLRSKRLLPPATSPRLHLFRRLRTARLSAVAAETPQTQEPPSPASPGEQFDWLDQWYPVAPVCDLDRRAPHGKTILGLDLVVWHDRTAGEWRVFDDACPHRLAPLSEGRVDPKGRLQCVYHGWCFDGQGACQFIPQAPSAGPPVHKNSKACVGVYPSVVQNNILWFYPRKDPHYKDILEKKRPPCIPELDDPSFVSIYGIRDMFYGYDVLVENLMDPAHVPYAHRGLMGGIRRREDPGRVEYDREGGGPLKMNIEDATITGFLSNQERGYFRFIAPCLIYGSPVHKEAEGQKKQPQALLIFMCIPVAPGRSRLIWAFPRNIGIWLNKIIPRWVFHIGQNLILDSDLYLLHVEEHKLAATGLQNWQKVCYVPTSSDSMVIAFRNWFRKYCKCQVGWVNPTTNQLPPAPPKDQLLNRYWSHVVQCTSCHAALKALTALEVTLQVMSIAVVGFLAVAKQSLITSVVQRTAVVSAAVLCFIASRWLANFIQKTFYFQDYNHAFK